MNTRNKNSNQSYWIIGKHAVEAALKNPKRIKSNLRKIPRKLFSCILRHLSILRKIPTKNIRSLFKKYHP